MAQFTVTWRDNGDDFMITVVELGDAIDPRQVSTNEWADLAFHAELAANGIPKEDMEGYLPSNDGYDMISVVRGVPDFIY
jgi:hypothetical protein